MNDFTASNGITVFVRESGTVQFQHGGCEGSCGILQIMPGSEWWEALRELFRAEEDTRLGRWRWPENPDITVRANGNDLVGVVKDDAEGRAYGQFHRGDRPNLDPMSRTAAAYFDAHPEPKPWHDAAPWEVWVVTIEGIEQAVMLDEDREFRDFRAKPDNFWVLHIKSDLITDARRIWPEVSE